MSYWTLRVCLTRGGISEFKFQIQDSGMGKPFAGLQIRQGERLRLPLTSFLLQKFQHSGGFGQDAGFEAGFAVGREKGRMDAWQRLPGLLGFRELLRVHRAQLKLQ